MVCRILTKNDIISTSKEVIKVIVLFHSTEPQLRDDSESVYKEGEDRDMSNALLITDAEATVAKNYIIPQVIIPSVPQPARRQTI